MRRNSGFMETSAMSLFKLIRQPIRPGLHIGTFQSFEILIRIVQLFPRCLVFSRENTRQEFHNMYSDQESNLNEY